MIERIERIEYAPCGIVVLNGDGIIQEVNHTLLDLLDLRMEDIVGKHFEMLLSPASKMIYHSYFYPSLHLEGTVKELIIKCNHSSGAEVCCMLSARLIKREQDFIIDCVMLEMTKRMQYELDLKHAHRQTTDAYLNIEKLMKEIENKQTELLKINEELVSLSNTDKLTGLKNRRFFQERFDQLYEQYISVGAPLYLLLIDIDFFKRVNDTFGHHAGDEVLAQLADVIQSTSSDQLEAFRYGGEEFALLVTAADGAYVEAMAERMRATVEKTAFTIGHITISIGWAKMKDNLKQDELFEIADKALYTSKQNGRNQVTFIS